MSDWITVNSGHACFPLLCINVPVSVSFVHHQTRQLSPSWTFNLNPLQPWWRNSYRPQIISCLLCLVLMVAFWPLRDWRRERRVRTEFFLHHPVVCLEFLPNQTLLESELPPPTPHQKKRSAEIRRHASAPLLTSSSQPQRRSLHNFKWIASPLVAARRLHCEIVHAWTAGLIVHWWTTLWVYPTRVLCGLQRTPLKARTDWPLFLAFLS